MNITLTDGKRPAYLLIPRKYNVGMPIQSDLDWLILYTAECKSSEFFEKRKAVPLVPINSNLKGPLYTIPGKRSLLSINHGTQVTVDIGYKYPDTPVSKLMTAAFDTRENILARFQVPPFIEGLYRISTFNSQLRECDRELVVTRISATDYSGDYAETYYYEDGDHRQPIGDNKRNGFLFNYGFDNNTNRFFYENNFPSILITREDGVFVHLQNTNICYAFSYHMWNQWSSIQSMELEIYRNEDLDGDPSYQNRYDNLIDILKVCYFMPDVFYFDRQFYDEELSYRITLHLLSRKFGIETIAKIERSYLTQLGHRISLFNTIQTELDSLI